MIEIAHTPPVEPTPPVGVSDAVPCSVAVVIPCSIICNVDAETDEGSMCPNPVTHTWHVEKWITHVCSLHAKRMAAVGEDVRPLNTDYPTAG